MQFRAYVIICLNEGTRLSLSLSLSLEHTVASGGRIRWGPTYAPYTVALQRRSMRKEPLCSAGLTSTPLADTYYRLMEMLPPAVLACSDSL